MTGCQPWNVSERLQMPEDIWKDRLGFGGLLLATCWDLLKELFLVVAALSLSKSKGTEYKTNQRAPTCPGTTHITLFEKRFSPPSHLYLEQDNMVEAVA